MTGKNYASVITRIYGGSGNCVLFFPGICFAKNPVWHTYGIGYLKKQYDQEIKIRRIPVVFNIF
jgi:hypothetical protein